MPAGKMCLEGAVHPVFENWATVDSELYEELSQPLLLASRIIENSLALEWISDFFIDDIFSKDYPGAQLSQPQGGINNKGNSTPYSIARHHIAPWASPEQKRLWLDNVSQEMSHGIAKSITWQLDADMFSQKGWSGYTCRHRRDNPFIPLGSKASRRGIYLTVLLMAEYPARLRDLRKKGLGGSEEYLLTAFMATITILHDHWVPRSRAGDNTNLTLLLQDQALPHYPVAADSRHSHDRHGDSPKREPCYLVPDFYLSDEGWKWKRRPGAPFRIPQYDDYMCPDLSLPIAPEYVMMEPRPRRRPQDTARSACMLPGVIIRITAADGRRGIPGPGSDGRGAELEIGWVLTS
ncbi:uncharacterized protein PG986_006006 [Apiospora aurea]|uniref:Uncharacterized protein n=1 Tax=Apiospora aurea TaxID=335848 RepID=A0ABR1QJ68_9PEZI